MVAGKSETQVPPANEGLLASWAARRSPPVRQARLSHRELYILPTRWGLIFTGLILLTGVTGINYQNAMILAAAFFLLGLALLHLLLTWRNLQQLSLRFESVESAHVGEKLRVHLAVEAPGRARCGIELGWPPLDYTITDLSADETRTLALEIPARQRGRFHAGRMLVTSCWPLGLFRCWSWQDLQVQGLVWPAIDDSWQGVLPGAGSEPSPTVVSGVQLGRRAVDGDEFSGVRAHQQGEPMTRVLWKRVAQTGQYLARDCQSATAADQWVDMAAYSGFEPEKRLELMCGHLHELARGPAAFGLRLPGLELPPASGITHLQHCLDQLALYPGTSA